MGNSLVKNNIHAVFHTKKNGITVADADLTRLFAYIGGIINNTDGVTLMVGGRPDHVHVLFSLPPTVALADYMRNLKAKSSHWLKGVSELYAKFAWQEGYGAFSVSPTLIEKTVNYIINQEEHHRKRTFREEVEMFFKAYGIEYDERTSLLQ